MAIPLKTGADLYNNELLRARLHNHPADALSEYGIGSFYFNNSSDLNSSNRIRYRGLTAWHSVANMEDIEDVKDLIKALSGSSSESVASVLGRVITLEGYFSNGKAKDADLLDGHNSDYFAEAATLNDLLEDYEAFKAVFSDNSDEYINTWTEVKDFLDGIKNTEDLNAILLGINTELGKKADKATTLAGYGITDAFVVGGIARTDLNTKKTNASYYVADVATNRPSAYGQLLVLHNEDTTGQLYIGYNSSDSMYWRGFADRETSPMAWRKILDENNYASELDTRYLQLTGGKLSTATNFKVLEVNSGVTDSVVYIALSTQDIQRGSVGYYNGLTYIGADTELSSARIGVTNDGEPQFWTASEGTKYALLHSGNYSDLITSLNNNLTVPSITIGGIKLSVVEGQLQIDGDAFATGQLSSGGIGSEGSDSGASGIVILEDWEKYDDTLAQVLGAGLGVGLRDKIAALESKATNVSVAQTLTSGKEIGAITIDGVATKLYAPSTYDHTEITGLASNYLKLSGGYIKGNVTIEGRLSLTEEILMRQHYLFVRPDSDADWVVTTKNWGKEYSLLHAGNYESIVGNKFLKLSGGTIQNLTGNMCPLYLLGNDTYVALGLSIGKNQPQAYLAYDGNELRYAKPDASWNTLLHANNFNTYALPITGGTISGALTIQSGDDGKLIFDNTDTETYWGLIYFKQNGKTYGRFGTQGTTDLSWNSNLILHSGNIGDFAFVPRTGIINNTDADTLLTNGVYLNATGNGSGNSNFPSTYSILMTFTQNSNYAAQLSVAGNAVHIRRKIDAWSDWKTVAFTDSNVASATKLQTARTIWGQSFDGTGNVSGHMSGVGNITMTRESAIRSMDRELVWASDTYCRFGYGYAWASLPTYIAGSNIYFSRGSAETTSMVINSSGNVTIGDTDYAGSKYKLFVQGEGRVSGGLSCIGLCGTRPTLGSAPSSGFIVDAYGKNTYGLSVWLENSGQSFIQSGRFDGDATAYALNLQPLGGVVCVGGRLLVNGAADDGTTALQVKGPSKLGGILTLPINHQIQWGDSGSMIYASATAMDIIAPISYFSSDVHVRGNLIVDGQVSSGGVAEAGTGGATGGSALDRLVFKIPANTTSFPCEHGLGTRDISVSIYENGNDFQQVLADVYLDSTNVARIVFGSATDVEHKVVIIG